MISETPEWGPDLPGHKWLCRRDGKIFYIHRPIKRKHKTTGKKYSSYKNISLGTSDEKEAIEEYVKRLGAPVARNRSVRCGAAFEKFIVERKLERATRDNYQSLWTNWVEDILRDLRVAEVEPEDIIRVLKRMEWEPSKKTGELVSDSRRYSAYVCMSSLFEFCMTVPHRYRDSNPCRYIGKDNVPPAPLQTEIDADELVIPDYMIDGLADYFMEKAAKTRRKDTRVNNIILSTYVKMHPCLGGRIAEILGLQVPHVQLPLEVVGRPSTKVGRVIINQQLDDAQLRAGDPSTWFKQVKGKKGTPGSKNRIVPLSPYAQRTIREYIELGTSEGWINEKGRLLLFPSTVSTPRSPGRVTIQVREAAEQLYGRRIVSHFFRHTYASNQFEGGASIEEVASLIGDTPATTEKRYVHLVNRDEFDSKVAARGRQ